MQQLICALVIVIRFTCNNSTADFCIVFSSYHSSYTIHNNITAIFIKARSWGGRYARARELQGLWLWPQRAARPGWAVLQPQELRAGPARGGKLPKPNFPDRRDLQAWEVLPDKAALTDLWRSLEGPAGQLCPGVGGGMGSNAHLTGTSRLQLPLPPLLQSPPRSLPKHHSPQGPRRPLKPSSPDRGNYTLLPSVMLWPGMMTRLHRESHSTKHFSILRVVKSLGAMVTSGEGIGAGTGELH